MIADIITIFPTMVEAALSEGIVGRARVRGLIEIRARDLRAFTDDRHRTVDDEPYGGGPGMVMKPEPLFRAAEAIDGERGGAPAHVILMTPQGRLLTHEVVERLSQVPRLIVICGRYEGIDERVATHLVAEEISIGDYVLTGGELAALVMLDAMARLVPGVVGDADSVAEDSFARGLLDHPHYTRPAAFREWTVPEVLMSGNHGAIEQWRRLERIRRTRSRRPELIDRATLTAEELAELDRAELADLEPESEATIGDGDSKR